MFFIYFACHEQKDEKKKETKKEEKKETSIKEKADSAEKPAAEKADGPKKLSKEERIAQRTEPKAAVVVVDGEVFFFGISLPNAHFFFICSLQNWF